MNDRRNDFFFVEHRTKSHGIRMQNSLAREMYFEAGWQGIRS